MRQSLGRYFISRLHANCCRILPPSIETKLNITGSSLSLLTRLARTVLKYVARMKMSSAKDL
jgi:hypothetical protein